MVESNDEKVEHRRHWRVKRGLPIRYKFTGEGDDRYRESKTYDISCGGLQFITTEPIPIYQSLEIEIQIPDVPDPIKTRAKVVGIQDFDEAEGMVRIRTTFEDLSEENKEILRRKVELKDITRLLKLMVEMKASDLHLTLNTPPALRINNEITWVDADPLEAVELRQMVYSLMNEEQRATFEKEKELDYGFSLPRIGRWRINVHIQRGSVEAAYRLIPSEIPSIKELRLPDVVDELARKKDGLIVVAGPAGAGKSTTLAAMLEVINTNFKKVIVTLEDPIEYIHTNKNCVIKQREVGSDTISFANALQHVLRQDPDVIFIGECRNLETMSVALMAAETGHLVLTTLHTSDTVQTIHRIVDFFPPHHRDLARFQLSVTLQGIICQKLLPREDIPGLIVATEVLVATPSIRTMIREAKYEHIPTTIQTGGRYKMHLMDTSLAKLYRERFISAETVRREAKDPEKILEMRRVYKPDIMGRNLE